MKESKRLFTSESVTDGHADKLCDQISDAVLDAYLSIDPNARVACECAATKGLLVVMGEITANGSVDVEAIARNVIRETGYNNPEFGFDADTCEVLVRLNKQSPDIAMGVNRSLESRENGGDSLLETGAGDQGMMFGYACNETQEYMPLPIFYAHALTRQLGSVRKDGTLPYLRPDGKAQVTVEYAGGVPSRIDTIVISAQHDDTVSQEQIRADLIEHVIAPVMVEGFAYVDDDTRLFTNPTGRFVLGGPAGDSGLTGRKIIVDTYGGYARHGGGAFSGKDPTKVDRSACYMARYIAKNIVAAGFADKCEVQLAYAIGVAQPVSVMVDTFATGRVADSSLEEAVRRCCDLRPEAIIRKLDLRKPIYRRTSNFGHFGDPNQPWEKLDMIDALNAALQDIALSESTLPEHAAESVLN